MGYPKNKILSNQFTQGGQFVYKSNSQPYNGYYYIIGGNRYFTGKEPSSTGNDIEIVIQNSNTQSNNKVNSQTYNPSQTQYITYKINEYPVKYKFIDENTFERLKSSKEYILIILPQGFNINLLNNEHPGLKDFLLTHVNI